jgi:hypothetical protein
LLLVVALVPALAAGFAFGVAFFAFLCFRTFVVGAGVVEPFASLLLAGALPVWAIRATPEIIRTVISFFMVFSLEAHSKASTPMDARPSAKVHEASFNNPSKR